MATWRVTRTWFVEASSAVGAMELAVPAGIADALDVTRVSGDAVVMAATEDLPLVVASGDLDEEAWGLLANVSGGDWTQQSQEWQDAVVRWRTRYHEKLDRRYPPPRPIDEATGPR